MGLLAVLVIKGSISLSYHILIEFAPPAVRYPPTNTTAIVLAVLPDIPPASSRS